MNYGDFDAMNAYAQMLFNGLGISVDHTEAARYSKIAADKGHPISIHNYGIIYNG